MYDKPTIKVNFLDRTDLQFKKAEYRTSGDFVIIHTNEKSYVIHLGMISSLEFIATNHDESQGNNS